MRTNDVFILGDGNDFRRYKKLNSFSKGLAVELGDDEVKEAMVSVSEDSRVYDNTKFVKVYYAGLLAMGRLSVGGRLLSYVLGRMLLEGNTIELRVESVLTGCGYSINSRTVYYRMVRELSEAGIMGKVSSKRYMVNPNMFYYGNRVKDRDDEVKDYFKRKN